MSLSLIDRSHQHSAKFGSRCIKNSCEKKYKTVKIYLCDERQIKGPHFLSLLYEWNPVDLRRSFEAVDSMMNELGMRQNHRNRIPPVNSSTCHGQKLLLILLFLSNKQWLMPTKLKQCCVPVWAGSLHIISNYLFLYDYIYIYVVGQLRCMQQI